MKRMLVAGCAGFIGTHLVRRLRRDGHRVIGVDNLSTGSIENVPLPGESFEFLRWDVTEPLEPLIKLGAAFDVVFNLACPASPVAYKRHPRETLLASVLGVDHLLRLGAARYVQASTSEVYGDPEVSPQYEGYRGNVDPLGWRACYDEGKRAAEALLAIAARRGADVRIARIFNTYGPGMQPDDGRVIPAFVTAALRGVPLRIYGSGKQTRSFCYVDDLVESLVGLAEAQTPWIPPIVVNLGNADEITIEDLAARVIRLTASSSTISYDAPLLDDPQRRCPDTRQAERILGRRTPVGIEDGLERTIAWFKSRTA